MDKENERGPGREGKTISSAKRSDERTSRRTRCAVTQRNVESGILERYEGVMLRFSTTSTLLNLHTLSSCLPPCLSLRLSSFIPHVFHTYCGHAFSLLQQCSLHNYTSLFTCFYLTFH